MLGTAIILHSKLDDLHLEPLLEHLIEFPVEHPDVAHRPNGGDGCAQLFHLFAYGPKRGGRNGRFDLPRRQVALDHVAQQRHQLVLDFCYMIAIVLIRIEIYNLIIIDNNMMRIEEMNKITLRA